MSQVKLVISGGQDGADIGALRGASAINCATGGFMPKGFLTEKGPNMQRATIYGLKESTGSYKERDQQNVDMADGVLAFLLDKPLTGRGTCSTVRYAETMEHKYEPFVKPVDANHLEVSGPDVKKPSLIIWLPEIDHLDFARRKEVFRPLYLIIHNYLLKHRIETLMVSGPCESTMPGINDAIRKLISTVLLYNRRGTIVDSK